MINFFEEIAMVSFINRQRRTNHKDFQNCLFACFWSQMEPKKVMQALKDPSWIEAMHKELLQFKLQDVWTLVDLPYGKRVIGSKWVFRNKLDERGIVIRNKERLVAQGHSHKEGIDYDKVFAPGTIEEEVYVFQPPGFEDPNFLDKVYKVKKALYGLHQAPRAWYETLFTYLLNNGFKMGQIDKTLFIKRNKDDILLVQVYVDDIIFGSTKKKMCDAFEILMHEKFQMSSMGELTFFLGLQVKQKQDGIFISQDKYVAEILKKFGFSEVKTASTPMETSKPLLKDKDGQEVDVHIYISMIGSLMYLTSSRLDIMFVVCTCARHQVSPKVSHLHAVKRIFRYLKGQPKFGLWKSTSGGCQFLGYRLISWQCKKWTVVANFTTEAEYVAASSCCGQIEALVDKKKVIITEDSIRSDLRLDDAEGTKCLLCEEIFEGLARIGRIGASFSGVITPLFDTMMVQAPADMGDIPVETHQTPIVDQPSTSQPQKPQKPKRKQRKEAKTSHDKSEDEDHVPSPSSDPLPSGRRVKSPMKKDGLGAQVDSSKQERMIEEIFQNTKIALDDETQGRTNDDEMFGVNDLAREEAVMDSVAPTTDVTEDEITIAQALAALKSVKPKQSQIPTISSSKDKGKAKMIEPEVSIKRKEQMRIYKEYARKLQAEEQEAARLSRAQQDEEANNSWEKIQAMMDAVRLLAERLQAREREELSKKVDKNVEPVVDDSKELRKCIEIVPDDGDEVLIEATSISSRSPTITDYKIHKEGRKTYFKIIRGDDIVKKEKPVDGMDNMLFRTLKTMSEHHVEDTIWKYQQGLAKMKN
uniref:Putative ribonuclease H-like domain-containing protein n=1 Tax=Tanacetum cinerariifolium TaxID=118510 RepID=A0A6L2J437_TANCI|nr:putative ribonuclease H-like domain-containing protein [Tanacetum cinerariifolium]